MRRLGVVVALQVGFVGILLFAWWAATATFLHSSTVIAAPGEVLSNLPSILDQETAQAISVTGREYGIAMLISIVFGLVVGSLVASSTPASRFTSSLMGVLITIPLVAEYPVLALAFGIGENSKIIIGVLSACPTITIATIGGIRRVDASLRDSIRSMGGGRWSIVLRAGIPGAAPEILGGISLGAAFGMVGVLLGEMLSAQQGVGPLVNKLSLTLQPAKLMGVILLVCMCSVAIIAVINGLERWQRRRTST